MPMVRVSNGGSDFHEAVSVYGYNVCYCNSDGYTDIADQHNRAGCLTKEYLDCQYSSTNRVIYALKPATYIELNSAAATASVTTLSESNSFPYRLSNINNYCSVVVID